VPIVLKSGSLNLLEPSGPVQACNGIALPSTVHLCYLYNVPTNAQLINSLLYCSILQHPYMFRHYCVIFKEPVVSTC